jgi:hypothetical protein
LDVSSFAPRQIITCGRCGIALSVPDDAAIVLVKLAVTPTKTPKSRNASVVFVLGTIAAVLLVIATIGAIAGIAYYLHYREIEQQNVYAKKYLDTFWIMYGEVPPNIRFADEDRSPAAFAAYAKRFATYKKNRAAMDREIQQRWGVDSQEFVRRYYRRHPWVNPVDVSEFDAMMMIGAQAAREHMARHKR